jgi:hypothetical protein
MENISLARAFKIRSQLKNLLNDLNIQYYNVEKYWEVQIPAGKNVEEILEKDLGPEYDLGESPLEIYQKILLLQQTIHDLNIAINNANQEKAQKTLLEINYNNDKIKLFKKVQEDMTLKIKPRKDINPVTGVETQIFTKVYITEPNIKKLLKEAQKQKNVLEDELSRINSVTGVFLDKDLQDSLQKLEI